MQKLTDQELQQALGKLPNWALKNGEIVQERTFKDFVAAMSFVNDVAQLAEAAGHHPDIDIRYNRVRLGSSHMTQGELHRTTRPLHRKSTTCAPDRNSSALAEICA